MRRDEGSTPMDPMVDPLRWELAIQSIMATSEPELERRRRDRPGAVAVLELWARPIFAVAASLALLASAALLTVGQVSDTQLAAAETSGLVAEALLPSELAAWIETGHALSADDLVLAIEER